MAPCERTRIGSGEGDARGGEEPNTAGFHLGVDVGGTFTDVVLWDADRNVVHSLKVLTTADRPSQGIFEGMDRVCAEAGTDPRSVRRFVHATTLVANAVIERKGARTALVTTLGFRDVLQLRRELRYDLFQTRLQFPESLVPRALRLELAERMDADGRPLEEPAPRDVHALVERLLELDVEAVAISFLHSYANAAHEEAVARSLAQAAPDLRLSLSSEVLPQIREYERTSTTVVNAYVQPLAGRYLAELARGLEERGCAARVSIVTSSGGTVSLETAARLPILLVESGPAAGITLAARLRGQAAGGDTVGFDMGGTTAKVCVVVGGRPDIRTDREIARTQRLKAGSGLPVGIPMMNLLEIGAGGGSIAVRDETGLVRVGPQSAGANPGPACYGLGGAQPTVTDANLLLGYLAEDAFLIEGRPLDRAAAHRAIAHHLGRPEDVDATQAAFAVYRIVTEAMAEALRVRAAEANVDLRRFELVGFGGAAGIHGVDIARRLGMARVVCPPRAGVFSAGGLLAAPVAVELQRSWIARVGELSVARVRDVFAALEREAEGVVRSAGAQPEGREYGADMSYVGQGFELRVAFPHLPDGDDEVGVLRECFNAEYERAYGRRLDGYEVQAVTWRVRVAGRDPVLPAFARRTEPGREGASRALYLDGAWVEAPVLDRRSLGPGETVTGPAVVEDADSTFVLPAGSRATVSPETDLVIEVRDG
jgi:N-methylhydantoinase A